MLWIKLIISSLSFVSCLNQINQIARHILLDNTIEEDKINLEANHLIEELTVGSEYKQYDINNIQKDQETQGLFPVKFFSFQVIEIYEDSDLFIMLRAIKDKSQAPTLILSKEHKYPRINTQGDVVCGTYEVSVCSIDSSEIIKNQTYYLGVYCSDNCQFGIKLQYQKERMINLRDNTVFNFIQSETQFIKVHVPAEQTGVDRIIIRAHLMYGSQENEAFYFYVNEGNQNPTASNYQWKGEEVWVTGKGVVIHNNTQHKILPDTNYTVVITAPEKTKLFLKAEYYGETRTIQLYDLIDDIVGPGEQNFYKIEVGYFYYSLLDKQDLSVDILPYEGNPDFYISPSPRPQNLSDYKWQSQIDLGFESIVLSTENRDYHDSNDLEFYVCVVGTQEVSSYSFNFYISDLQVRQLSTTSTESGFLQTNEIIQYTVDIENIYQNDTYTIQTSMAEGKAIIGLKLCILTKNQEENFGTLTEDDNNYFGCRLSESDFDSLEKSQFEKKLQPTFSSLVIISTGSIKFEYDADLCTINMPSIFTQAGELLISRCKYIFGVRGKQDSQNKFIITLKNKETHIPLTEGQPIRGFLMQKDRDYYIFSLREKQVYEVEFQITVLNGDIKVWASRNNQIPGPEDYERSAMYNLDVIDFKEIEGKPMDQQDYYLTVEADSLSEYTITTTLKYSMKSRSSVISLIEGVPQEFTVNKDFPQYFNIENNQKSDIFIYLESNQGSGQAYVVVNPKGTQIDKLQIPSTNNYQWSFSSSQRILIIKTTDPNFSSNGQYRIAIYTDQNSSQLEILYVTQASITLLKTGKAHYAEISDDEILYYQFKIQENIDELIITRTITTYNLDDQDDVILYISFNDSYPGPSTPDVTILEGRKNNQLILNVSNIRIEKCQDGEICSLHISARSSGGTNDFTLLVRGKGEPVQLLEGIEQNMPFPLVGQDQYVQLYFRIAFNSTVKIQLNSVPVNLDILANIVSYQEVSSIIYKLQTQSVNSKNSIQEYKNFKDLFPTYENHQFNQTDNSVMGSQLLVIHQQELSNFECHKTQDGCVLLISISVPPKSIWVKSQTDPGTYFGEETTFLIEASGHVTTIHPGEVLLGYTQDNIFEYYKLIIQHEVKIIELSVSALDDGDPDIFVKKQISGQPEQYPTYEINDFHSITYKSEALIIQQSDPFFKNQSIIGTYLIGILGFKDSHFSLEVNLANIQFYNIQSGLLLEKITLKPQQLFENNYDNYVFFRYNHYKPIFFKINIIGYQKNLIYGVQRHGSGNIWQANSQSVFDYLPFVNITKPTWQNSNLDNIFGGVFKISPKDTNFCSYCSFIIGVQNTDAENDVTLSIAIATENQTIPLQAGKLMIDSATESKANYYSFQSQSGSVEFKLEIYDGIGDFAIGFYQYLSVSPLKYQDGVGTKSSLIINPYGGDQLTIRIKPKYNSVNYTLIAITQSDQEITFGNTQTGVIAEKKSQKLIFQSDGRKDEITIHATFYTQTENVSSFTLSINFIDDKRQSKAVIPNNSIWKENILKMTTQMPQKNGYYEIQIQNHLEEEIEYSIILNRGNFHYLMNNNELLYEQKVNETKELISYLRENELLYFELYECIGSIQTNLPHNANNIYNISRESPGDINFQITAVQGEINQKSKFNQTLYYGIPHILDKDSILPLDLFQIKNQINITQEQEKISFNFYPVECTQQSCELSNYKIDKIIYSLHLTNEQKFLEAFSTCSLPYQVISKFTNSTEIQHKKYILTYDNFINSSTLNLTIENKDIDINQKYLKEKRFLLYYQLIAQVYFKGLAAPFIFKYLPNYFDYKLLYQNLQSQNTTQNSDIQPEKFYDKLINLFKDQQTIWILAGCITAIFLLCFSKWLRLKYRKTQLKEVRAKISYDDDEKQL